MEPNDAREVTAVIDCGSASAAANDDPDVHRSSPISVDVIAGRQLHVHHFRVEIAQRLKASYEKIGTIYIGGNSTTGAEDGGVCQHKQGPQ